MPSPNRRRCPPEPLTDDQCQRPLSSGNVKRPHERHGALSVEEAAHRRGTRRIGLLVHEQPRQQRRVHVHRGTSGPTGRLIGSARGDGCAVRPSQEGSAGRRRRGTHRTAGTATPSTRRLQDREAVERERAPNSRGGSRRGARHEKTVRRMIGRGDIPARLVAGRWLIDPRDLPTRLPRSQGDTGYRRCLGRCPGRWRRRVDDDECILVVLQR